MHCWAFGPEAADRRILTRLGTLQCTREPLRHFYDRSGSAACEKQRRTIFSVVFLLLNVKCEYTDATALDFKGVDILVQATVNIQQCETLNNVFVTIWLMLKCWK